MIEEINNNFSSSFNCEVRKHLNKKLITINNETFKYNKQSLPIIYRSAKFKWKCKNLVAIDNIVRYKYNKQNLRIKKFYNGNITIFKYKNHKLVEQNNGYKLYFKYQNSMLVGFNFVIENFINLSYRFKFNKMKDVVGIYNSDDVLICKYSYFQSGLSSICVLNKNGEYINIEKGYDKNSFDLLDIFISNLNPIRFRSYYLDLETGLYYNNGKYYDPEIQRYIN